MVNDSLCVASGTDYPIYAVGGQPWQLYWQKNITIGNQFELLTGGGQDLLAWYTAFAPALSGLSWTHTAWDPTDAELQTGSYWTAVANAKNTKIIKVLYKGDA